MAAKLLLADDSVTVQRVIELTFADEGLEVLSVGDGRQAIERAEQERPDIILADVSMPERDGYEVAAYVKNTPHLSKIPVVLMTGAFEPLDEARARAVGCDGVLAKPFEPQMVIALVRELLGRAAGTDTGAPTAEEARRPAAAASGPAEPVSGGAVPLDAYLEQLDEALSAAAAGAPRPTPAGAVGRVEPVAPTGDQAPSLADAFSALLADELGEAPLPSAWGSLAGSLAGGTPAAHAAAAAPPAESELSAAGPQPGHTAALPAPMAPVTDALLDDLTRRVAERLADSAVRDLVSRHVVEVAERLVREEIERIKSHKV